MHFLSRFFCCIVPLPLAVEVGSFARGLQGLLWASVDDLTLIFLYGQLGSIVVNVLLELTLSQDYILYAYTSQFELSILALDFLNMLCHFMVVFNAFQCLSHDPQLYPEWWHKKTRCHCSMWLLLVIVLSLPATSTDILWIWTLTILGNVDPVSASHTQGKTTLIVLDVAFSSRHRVCGLSPWNFGAGTVQPSLAKAWKQQVLVFQPCKTVLFQTIETQ